ncbi:hypothetical protein GCM10027082_24190 [Comamonas humi]
MDKQTQSGLESLGLAVTPRPSRRLADLKGAQVADDQAIPPVEQPKDYGSDERRRRLQSESIARTDLPKPEAQPQTYSLRAERIRELPDEKLMQYLTRESVPQDGILDEGAKMAITMELMRRQSEKLQPKSWRHDRNYLAALAAAVFGAVATVLAAWDFFSK